MIFDYTKLDIIINGHPQLLWDDEKKALYYVFDDGSFYTLTQDAKTRDFKFADNVPEDIKAEEEMLNDVFADWVPE